MSPLALSTRFLQTQSDERLLELSRAGHERAFEALVKRYRRELHAHCRRLCGTSGAPDDVFQQALLQAWMAIGAGAEVHDLRAWLHRIVHNAAISQMRRARPESDTGLDLAQGSRGADAEAEQRLAARAALAGLAALPDLQRQVMLSTAIDGLSHEEVASTLGLSDGSVRGLIYRARATLRTAAAALTPAPLINWVARRGDTPGSRSMEAIAGGGSAGVGGLLIKGGAIVVGASALATTGLTTAHHAGHSHRHAPRPSLVAARARVGSEAQRPVSGRVLVLASSSTSGLSIARGHRSGQRQQTGSSHLTVGSSTYTPSAPGATPTGGRQSSRHGGGSGDGSHGGGGDHGSGSGSGGPGPGGSGSGSGDGGSGGSSGSGSSHGGSGGSGSGDGGSSGSGDGGSGGSGSGSGDGGSGGSGSGSGDGGSGGSGSSHGGSGGSGSGDGGSGGSGSGSGSGDGGSSGSGS